MHELSICQSIVNAALEEVARLDPPPRLRSLQIVCGALHQIVPEFLVDAYRILSRDTVLAGSELKIRIVPVTGRCRQCAWEGEITPPVFQCGACEQFEIELLAGKELFLDRLEVETDEHT